MDRHDYGRAVATIHEARGDLSTWLARVTEALAPLLGRPADLAAYHYDCDEGPAQRLRDAHCIGVAGELFGVSREVAPAVDGALMASMYAHDVALGSEIPAVTQFSTLGRALSPRYPLEWLGLNAKTGRAAGLHIAVPLEVGARLAPRRRAALRRVAAHVALAYRRRFAAGGPLGAAAGDVDLGAALSLGGGVHPGAALDVPRAVLERAARFADLPITRQQALAPAAVAELWESFLEGGLELVETQDTEGRRFFVLRPLAPGAAPALSRHEQRILAGGLLGERQKHIAYSLGVTESTASRLRQRALRAVRPASDDDR
jgi:hypothetical protein